VFFRDVIFYIGALVILVIASIHGYINILFAVIYLAWYAIFVVFVLIEDVAQRREMRALAARENDDDPFLDKDEDGNINATQDRGSKLEEELTPNELERSESYQSDSI
jgi:Ca2+/Na+ antiporter